MLENLGQRLDENAARYPEKPAFIFAARSQPWRRLTFRQLLAASNEIARGFTPSGIRQGMRAALMVSPGVEFFALVMALLRTGVVPIMIDPAIGLPNVTRCFAVSKPEIYFGTPASHAIRWLWGWGRASIRLNVTTDKIGRIGGSMSLADIRRAGRDHAPFTPIDPPPQQEAAIIYTSGSTGLPKGAIYTHGNFAAQLNLLARTFDIRPDAVDLPAFPLFALIDCLLGLTAIIPDIHFPRRAAINPAQTLQAIQTYQVNTMFASPIVLDRLAAYGLKNRLQLPSLKRVITAGAPAPAPVLERFWRMLPADAHLFSTYGATEVLPVSWLDSRVILQETRRPSAQGAGICVGYPAEATSVRIIPISDDPIAHWRDTQPLPVGEIGEIVVKSLAVTAAYVDSAEVNALAKIQDADEQVLHRMGDLGYLDEQGRLWYCGRKSHRVITTGEVLFTESIEGIFNAHPLVYRTALVGVTRAGVVEPVLWVQLEPAARRVKREKIRQELLALGATHPQAGQIKTILFHPAFPTDTRHNSKIIREKLAQQAQKQVSA